MDGDNLQEMSNPVYEKIETYLKKKKRKKKSHLLKILFWVQNFKSSLHRIS